MISLKGQVEYKKMRCSQFYLNSLKKYLGFSIWLSNLYLLSQYFPGVSLSRIHYSHMYIYICPFIYLFICLSVYQSINLPIYLSICLFIYLSICLFIYLSIICLSVCLSVCLQTVLLSQTKFQQTGFSIPKERAYMLCMHLIIWRGFNQGTLKAEVSLYSWPPIWPV